jgi:hypothetical protein
MGSEILTIDRALTDLSTIKISDLYYVPSGQERPLKNGFFIKTRIFRVGFLPRNSSVWELVVRN